jgi:uncharacterized protein (DUF983 family)
LGALISRGLRKVCPHCGEGKVFSGWFRMDPRCSSCDYPFEREEGYWTGAMIVNIAVVEAWFALLFMVVLIVTMPDPNWGAILGVALGTNLILPIVFYPYSKTLWMAGDLYVHPLEEREHPG